MAYNIFWLRHGGRDAATLHRAAGVTDLRAFLASAAANSEEDAACLAALVESRTHTADSELHLPTASRFDGHAGAWMSGASVWQPATDVLAVARASRPCAGYVEQMFAAAAGLPAAESLPPLHVTLAVDSPSTDGLVTLLRAFDVNEGLPRGASRNASLTFSINGNAMANWTVAPRDCTAAYYPVWGRVAGAVQQSARAWVRFLMLSRPERFLDVPDARAALLYWISAPRVSITQRRLCWDLLADGMETNPLRNIGARRLSCEIATVRHHLLGTAAAPIWARTTAARLRQAAWANPSAVHAAAGLDASLTSAVTRLASHWQSAPRRIESAHTVAAASLHSLRIALQRSMLAPFALPLSMLLFFEATAALSRALHRTSGFSLQAEVENENGIRVYRAGEKNPRAAALHWQESPCTEPEPLPLAA